MTLSIIGAGNVGRALAGAFVRQKQAVVVGVPEPAKYRAALAPLGPLVRLTGTAEAVDAGDVVILAVPYAVADGVARSVTDWQGKVLVDATNPIAPGLAGLAIGTTTSGAETIAAAAQGARVVKAFNATGAENMADPRYPGGLPLMPVCGDDADARRQALALATLIGFEAVDFGELSAARYLEPLAMAWIHLALKRGHGRDFAFAMLRRGER